MALQTLPSPCATKALELEAYSSAGWALTSTVPSSVTLAPGETARINVRVLVPASASAGETEVPLLTAVAISDYTLVGSAATALTTVVDRLYSYLPIIRRAQAVPLSTRELAFIDRGQSQRGGLSVYGSFGARSSESDGWLRLTMPSMASAMCASAMCGSSLSTRM